MNLSTWKDQNTTQLRAARAKAREQLGNAYDATVKWLRVEKDRPLQIVAQDAINAMDSALADLLAQAEEDQSK